MAMFKGFKPQGLQKIANSMGYTGSLEGFDSYLQQNPDKQNMMNMYNQRAIQMAQGGAVRRMQVGGTPIATQTVGRGPNPSDLEQFPIIENGTPLQTQKQAPTTTLGTGEGQVDAYGDVATTTTDEDGNVVKGTRPANIADVTAKMAQTGAIPEGAVTKVETIQQDPRQEIATGTGEVGAQTDATVTTAGTAQAGDAQQVTAAQMEAETVTDKVTDALQANQAAQ